MRSVLFVVALAVCFAWPSSAMAAKRCHYSGDAWGPFPQVAHLRASGTSCMAAEGVAALIRRHWHYHHRFPRHVHPRSAHFDWGRFSCRYPVRRVPGETTRYKAAVCTRGGRRVTMRLYS